MTEMTPLALKLRTVYHDPVATSGYDTGHRWNAVAKVAEAELTAQRAVRLPTMEECHRATADRYEQCWNFDTDDYWDWYASTVFDLVGSLNPTWVEVPPDATIPSGTRVRVEYQEYAHRAQEWATEVDRTPAMWQAGVVYLVPSGTVLKFPLDPRIEATAKAIHDADPQCWCPDIDDQCWDTASTDIRDLYVRLAKAAIAALGEDI